MDYKDPQVKRYKKSDKQKERQERNGGYSKKHIRVKTSAVATAAAPPL